MRCSNSQNVLSSFCLSSLRLPDRVFGTSLWKWGLSRKCVVAKRSRRHTSNSCSLCPSASLCLMVSEPDVSRTHLAVSSNGFMRDTPQCTCKPWPHRRARTRKLWQLQGDHGGKELWAMDWGVLSWENRTVGELANTTCKILTTWQLSLCTCYPHFMDFPFLSDVIKAHWDYLKFLVFFFKLCFQVHNLFFSLGNRILAAGAVSLKRISLKRG